MLNKKRICVFGAGGFLGSHIVDALVKQGFQVVGFDLNTSKYLPSATSDSVIQVQGSINDFELVESVVEGCYAVYNCAALADLDQCLNDPFGSAHTNIMGNITILEACRNAAVERFLFASSVYVKSRDGGFYRCSKQACEEYIKEYQDTYAVDYTILRYGSLYGPRSNVANGLYRIVKNALDTGVISYTGSKDAVREYIHVEDAATASVEVLAEEFRNQTMVLTGQESMRVIDVLEMLREILGSNYDVKFDAGRQVGHYVRTPYAYDEAPARKLCLSSYFDLGQGLVQLVSELSSESSLSIECND